jgi:regulatory protein
MATGMPPRPASIKVRALQWLAQREHSRDELRGKLLRLKQRRPARTDEGVGEALELPYAGHVPLRMPTELAEPAVDPAAEVETLLCWLEAHGHLSQERFVESRVHARQSRFGNLRIRQELQQHGVTLDPDTQQALQRSEFDRAHALWCKKYGGPSDDAAARLRQMRFLAGRGFSIDVVRRVVKGGAARDIDDVDSPAR